MKKIEKQDPKDNWEDSANKIKTCNVYQAFKTIRYKLYEDL